MQRNNILRVFMFLCSMFLLTLGCKQGKNENNQDFSISLRISRDPATLNPIKNSGTVENDISQYLFLPLADYDPYTLELVPVLIAALPSGVRIDTGRWSGTVRFDCLIREEAVWDDGSPVTGYDYLFTIKAIKHPDIMANPALKSIFQVMRDVEISEDDPKRFFIYVESSYFTAKELALIVPVYPEYLYDPGKALRQYDLENAELTADKTSITPQDSLVRAFVDRFNHMDCGRVLANGSNAYELAEWQTNQHVILQRKPDWWGNKLHHSPYFEAQPTRIIFKVIPDPNTALLALKSDQLDILDQVDGHSFAKFKEEDASKGSFSFDTPGRLVYYFVGINNHAPLLKDKNVRKALAHLMDVDLFIKNFEMGNGIRLQSPVLPLRSYYHAGLKPIMNDPVKAKSYLKKAGWADSDKDGVLDKFLDGRKTDLKLRILIPGNDLSKNLALMLQQNCREVGIGIEIITKDPKLIPQDVASRNFDLYPTGVQLGLYPEDFYQSWHSSNDFPGGSNRFGFNHPKADQLLERLRETPEPEKTKQLMKEFQQIIYDEQPLIFLYVPTNNIVYNQRLQVKTSIKAPGFFVNTIRTKAKNQ
ncbi:MAG TPA: hypothetical protein DCQ58_02795 [Saprospirales bacterium]|nr:hypothetical protein [Saprospirales bacterium]